MYKRRSRKPSIEKSQSLLLSSINRGSDIVQPENTSLLVNQSRISEEISDDLPKSVTSCLLSDDDNSDPELSLDRRTNTVMQSMSHKLQSTRKNLSPTVTGNILRDWNASQNIAGTLSTSKNASQNKNSFVWNKSTEGALPKLKNSCLLDVLAEFNVQELSGEESFQLPEDQAMFAIKLDKKLSSHEVLLENFLKSLEEYISNTSRLKKLLVMTQTASECETARGPIQDPLLRILLQVDCLQKKVLAIIEQLLFKIINDSGDTADQQLVTAILRQVRFINRPRDTNFGKTLLDIIKKASIGIKKEMIFMLPELVIEDEAELASRKLIDMVQATPSLTPVVVDALTNVPLSSSLRDEVRNKIISGLNNCPGEQLPLLIKFCVNRCETLEAQQVANLLHEHLPLSQEYFASHGTPNNSFLIPLFEHLKFSVITSKSMTASWLKTIAHGNSPNDFKPIDCVMLIIIGGCVIGRKSNILSLVRNRIKQGIFTEAHVEELFKILNCVLTAYSKEVIELASSLLKSFEQPVIDVAVTFYREAFASFNPFLRQDLINDLVNHVTSGTSCAAQAALKVLKEIRALHHSELRHHIPSIVSMLTSIYELDMGQIRQLMDIIASLTLQSDDRETSSFAEEVEIFIRKLLSSSCALVQSKGIVSALMLVKYIVGNEHCDSDETSKANSLLKMALGFQKKDEFRQGFFYDEFALLLRQISSNEALVAHWREHAFHLLKSHAFVRDLDFQCDHFPMSVQYSLECDKKLVFPVVAFVVNPSSVGDLSPALISPALRLLWCSSSKKVSDLLPLLCAGVILPDPEVFDDFCNLQVAQQRVIMDCLFLCANYFLECINAFCTQPTGDKVIIRLKQFIEVRALIMKFIGEIPEYCPPVSQFHLPTAKRVVKEKQNTEGVKKNTKQGRKRKSDGTVADPPNNSTLDVSSTQNILPSTSKDSPTKAVEQLVVQKNETHFDRYQGFFRTLNCHVFKLLKIGLKLSPTKVFKKKKTSDLAACNVSWSYRPEEKPELGPGEILFLLEDYIQKLEVILSPPKPHFLTKNKSSGLVYEQIPTEKFLTSSIKLLPKLYFKLDFTREHLKTVLQANEGIWDSAAMFHGNINDFKLIYSSICKVISDLLSWPGMFKPQHKSSFTDVLKVLCGENAQELDPAELSNFAEKAVENLSTFIDYACLLPGAISLVKSVQVCLNHTSCPSNLTILAEMSEKLLKRPWFTLSGARDNGPHYNQQIDCLLRTYFASVNDKLDTVQRIAEIATTESEALHSKESQMETYPSLTKSNFPLLYRALCEALVTSASATLSQCGEDHERAIHVWASITRVLMLLVDIVKLQNSRMNLATILKRSQSIIQMFLNKGLPVMESALRVKSDQVLKLLKSLQAITRFLHSICCHSKVTSDAVIGAHVPNIRALCERLTLAVKAMLISNKIPLDCITIAVLKNRDLKGNDILSQTASFDGDDDEECNIPAEEDQEQGDESCEEMIIEADPTDMD